MHNGNPHLHCNFLDDENLVATGFDKVPYIYKKQGATWQQSSCLDDGLANKRQAKITGNSFLDKKVYFNADFKLSTNVELAESDTRHANFINCVKPFQMQGSKILSLCTSDINGYLNYWDVSKA